MSASHRTFGALISHESVALVEYRTERSGIRVVDQWTDVTRSVSVDEALARLLAIISARNVREATLSVVVEQFGVFHHVMMLPGASDEVVRPIILREVERVFGVSDPIIAYTRGEMQERRGGRRADARTAPTQVFVAGAPSDTLHALLQIMKAKRIHVNVATVIPKAMHSLYEAIGASHEATAVLVCLEGGPHLGFFLDGRLELAVDPPIALEGERASVATILDQVERSVVYFRQQFRGATPTRLLLAARGDEFDTLSAALEAQLGAPVRALFPGLTSPEAVISMGAVLEGQRDNPLDLFPHPPTISERVTKLLRGPNGVVAATATAAAIAVLWASTQFFGVKTARKQSDALRASVGAALPSVGSMREIAERRADASKRVQYLQNVNNERATLTQSLGAIAGAAPTGVYFDTLQLSRAASGWKATLAGQSVAGTAAQAVRSLDTFFQTVRGGSGVTDATLDRFDYPVAKTASDSTTILSGAVVIQFHMSFGMALTTKGAR